MKRRIAFGAVLIAVIALGTAIYASAAPRAGAAGTPSASTVVGLTMTIVVTGQSQGSFGKAVPVIAVSHEIVSPRDPTSGLPTGRRQHRPISVTTQWGPTTPKFIKALVNNENLKSVQINLLSNGIVTANIKLTNASVAHFGQTDQNVQFEMTYQKIQWTWVSGGITALDDWAAPAT